MTQSWFEKVARLMRLIGDQGTVDICMSCSEEGRLAGTKVALSQEGQVQGDQQNSKPYMKRVTKAVRYPSRRPKNGSCRSGHATLCK